MSTRLIHFTTLVFILASTAFAKAQTFTAKVLDAKTQEPIPFATVQYAENRGVITNDEGMFTLQTHELAAVQNAVTISSMGYEELALTIGVVKDTVITLTPKAFELKGVFLTSKPLSAKQIIDSVKAHIANNYYQPALYKRDIFFRTSSFSVMDKVDLDYKKSTISEFNKPFIDSIAMLIPRSSDHYQEVAGSFYGNYGKNKLIIDKAAELYDKSKDVSLDGLGDKIERVFKEKVKPDSYLKIKSGWFSTKVQMDSILKENQDAEKVAEKVAENQNRWNLTTATKDRMSELYEQLIFNEDSKLDVLRKSNRYHFTQEDYTYLDNEPVYIVQFTPKGKKDFKGTLYINTNDFAIVRADFENVRPLFKFGLLGITYSDHVYRGTMLFQRDASNTYSPKYVQLEQGSTFGIDRPLKIVEKNKNVRGRRKQNELRLKIDVAGNEINKYELVVFNTTPLAQNDFDSTQENKETKATYLHKYDPEFWKGYTIMEPNAAIQSFEVVD